MQHLKVYESEDVKNSLSTTFPARYGLCSPSAPHCKVKKLTYINVNLLAENWWLRLTPKVLY